MADPNPNDGLHNRATLPKHDADLPRPRALLRRDTHIDEAPSSRPPAVSLDEAPLWEEAGDRYHGSSQLGEGGMGEVRLCHDRRIGRDVAMKVIKPALAGRADVELRFVREARVQGQLEHPAVVPVYDLGASESGETWFTMKRVHGRTLAEILEGLGDGSEEHLTRYSRRRLLSAFSSVCLAVDFAHNRGVLHRDLKPGNIMLGDFGEVYLLDWGLAKLLSEPNAAAPALAPATPAVDDDRTRRDIALPNSPTQGGSIFGTPGYMPPEQVRGEVLGPAADVYALGSILFELITGERLHPQSTIAEIFASTITGGGSEGGGVDARPSARRPDRDLPPELDAICLRATALEAADRYAGARELQEEIERFLDGDRDLALRHQLSTRHAEQAAAAAEMAIGGALDSRAAEEERSRAMREVSRSLALDPQNAIAARTMVQLIMTAPPSLPPEAEKEMDDAEHASMSEAARNGSLVYLSWLVFAPGIFLLGLRSYREALLTGALMALSAALSFAVSRRPRHLLPHVALLLVSSAGIAAASRAFGPFIIVPAVAAANTLGFLMSPNRKVRPLIIVLGVLVIFVPLGLEYLGVLPHSYVFRDGAMLLLPQMHDLPETGTIVFLCFAHAAILVVSALYVARVRSSLTAAERRLQLYAWHLRKMLPDDTQGAMPPTSRRGDTWCPIMPYETSGKC